MGFGGHGENGATQGLPYLLRLAHLCGACFRQWCEDGAAVFVEIAFCMFDTCKLFASNRVGRHKAGQALAQGLAGGGDYIALGRTYVH